MGALDLIRTFTNSKLALRASQHTLKEFETLTKTAMSMVRPVDLEHAHFSFGVNKEVLNGRSGLRFPLESQFWENRNEFQFGLEEIILCRALGEYREHEDSSWLLNV